MGEVIVNLDFSNGEIVENLLNGGLFNWVLWDIQLLFILFEEVEHFSDRDFHLDLESVEAVEVFDNLVLSEVLINEFNDMLSVFFDHGEFYQLLNKDSLSLKLEVDGWSVTILGEVLFQVLEVKGG